MLLRPTGLLSKLTEFYRALTDCTSVLGLAIQVLPKVNYGVDSPISSGN